MYPIMITTYERPQYFQECIESLIKTNADLSNVYVFDDFSKNKDKETLLSNYANQFNVIYRQRQLGTTLNTVWAIEYLYNKFPESEYIIFLQDDIIFSKNWLKNGLHILRKIDEKENLKIGFLCLYNKSKNSEKLYYILPSGHPGGVTWIIKREFWAAFRNKYNVIDEYYVDRIPKNLMRRHFILNVVDYKIAHAAHLINWHNARVGRSLVQHIGDKSSVTNRDMTEHRSDNFVGVNA